MWSVLLSKMENKLRTKLLFRSQLRLTLIAIQTSMLTARFVGSNTSFIIREWGYCGCARVRWAWWQIRKRLLEFFEWSCNVLCTLPDWCFERCSLAQRGLGRRIFSWLRHDGKLDWHTFDQVDFILCQSQISIYKSFSALSELWLACLCSIGEGRGTKIVLRLSLA